MYNTARGVYVVLRLAKCYITKKKQTKQNYETCEAGCTQLSF